MSDKHEGETSVRSLTRARKYLCWLVLSAGLAAMVPMLLHLNAVLAWRQSEGVQARSVFEDMGLVPSYRGWRPQCANNLKQLGLAVLNYAHTHGSFPERAGTRGKNSIAVSWRVLVLPYMEQEQAYEAWNFDARWNDARNSKITSVRFPGVVCPCHANRSAAITSYVAVTGPETCWPDDGAVLLEDIKDGASQTILLIELPASNIAFTEPRDISMDEAINLLTQNELDGAHRSPPTFPAVPGKPYIHAIFADGSWRPIPLGAPKEILRALFTISGREGLTNEDFESMWTLKRTY